MIKVIEKTFAILEEIVLASPKPLTPGMAAERTGVNRVTAWRILRELMEAGYVIRVSRSEGYTVGPRVHALAQAADFWGEFMRCAVPVVDRVAARIEDFALISRCWHTQRYILYQSNGNPRHPIHLNSLSWQDSYSMATGVIEMAYLPLERALEIYDRTPDEERLNFLPEFRNRSEVPGALAVLRQQGYYHFLRRDAGIGIFGFPTFSRGKFAAALGCSVDFAKAYGPMGEFIFETGRKAAEEITMRLAATRFSAERTDE